MVITSRALIFNTDGKLFVVKHVPTQSYWALPGGKMDEGEDSLTCFLREMKEELGLEDLQPKLAFIVEAPRINRLEFFFYCIVEDPSLLLSQDGEMAYELVDRTFLDPKTTTEDILPDFLHQYGKEDIEKLIEPKYIKEKK